MKDKTRILIVDDEPDMCWALENILRPAGVTVQGVVSQRISNKSLTFL